MMDWNKSLGFSVGERRHVHREIKEKSSGNQRKQAGNGEYAALSLLFQQTIPGRDVAFDGDFIPLLGMAHEVYRPIVVLAPEERYRVEDLLLSQHIVRGGLALAFRQHLMLDPEGFLGVWIVPARHISPVA